MIISKRDVEQFYCCTQPGRCKGTKCMAWVPLMIEDKSHDANKLKAPKLIESDKGYCGLIKQ